MAFIDDMKGKFTQASQTTMKKAKDLSELAKLNGSISEAEKQINELYGKIGFEVYRAYSENPLPEAAELIAQVSELHRKIEDCRAQIKAINAANTCPQCGAKVAKGMSFCGECGFKLPAPKQPETSEAAPGFCSNCGAQLPEGAMFCTECGTKVD